MLLFLCSSFSLILLNSVALWLLSRQSLWGYKASCFTPASIHLAQVEAATYNSSRRPTVVTFPWTDDNTDGWPLPVAFFHHCYSTPIYDSGGSLCLEGGSTEFNCTCLLLPWTQTTMRKSSSMGFEVEMQSRHISRTVPQPSLWPWGAVNMPLIVQENR